MNYFVFSDMFAFVIHGIVALADKDIISIQPTGDEDDEFNVFYWTEIDGQKVVDVLQDVAAFDTEAEAHAWVVADLPEFIEMVKEDQAEYKGVLKEMKKMLKTAGQRVDEAQAGMAGEKAKILKAVPK